MSRMCWNCGHFSALEEPRKLEEPGGLYSRAIYGLCFAHLEQGCQVKETYNWTCAWWKKKTTKPETLKIKEVTEEAIIMDNGDRIEYRHFEDCCEENYADFKQLDDLARQHEYKTPLRFEAVEESGFRFGDESYMAFVPCYSEQNGYYSANIQITYNGKLMLDFDAEMR